MKTETDRPRDEEWLDGKLSQLQAASPAQRCAHRTRIAWSNRKHKLSKLLQTAEAVLGMQLYVTGVDSAQE